MALVMVMLLTVAVAALAAGAIFLTSSANVLSRGHEREEDMRNAADAGIELGRSALNGSPALFPDTGFVAFQVGQAVYDANGVQISGVTRSIYFGPTGSATGQYGVFGSVVSVIQDPGGAVVVRRGELAQESFARFAYYTDDEGTGICFGGGDQIFGPLHTNDDMCIYSSGARFRSTVEVAGTITGKQYGTFDQGFLERGAVIPLPTIADLAKLNTYATQGGMSFSAPTGGTVGTAQARMRIEFLSIDLDGDGRVTGSNEGFFRIYEDNGGANPDWVTASRPSTANTSRNCGDFHTVSGSTTFYSAAYHLNPANPLPGGSITHSSTRSTAASQSLTQSNSRCFLGGDDRLMVTTAAGGPSPRNTFQAADSLGRWIQYTNTPDPAVVAGLKNPASGTVDTSLAARTLLAQHLWPLSRSFNPNTKGVIYVTGKLVLSGVVHSRVTIAATDNIVVADDLRYAVAPGSAPCATSDMLGLLTPASVYVADNTINAPWNGSGSYRTYDDTRDEFLQGVILALNLFTAENYSTGSTSAEPCETTSWGRGCLYLTGGIIVDTRGAVGTTGGTGYLKRYAYDQCAFQTPPPYFPTTGRFIRNRYYEIDPVGFDVATFFRSLTPNP
jgi:hypothetical protein